MGEGAFYHLMYAWHTSSGWLTETVDETSYTGRFASLALAPVSPYTPHIASFAAGYSDLKHAWRTPAGWQDEIVDSDGQVGYHASLDLAPTSPYTPQIVHWDKTNNLFKHAWWTPDGWVNETVGAASLDGLLPHTSLALEGAAPHTPHVAYQDSSDDLYHAWRVPGNFLPAVGAAERSVEAVRGHLWEKETPHGHHRLA
jgi:hypothetical protein